MWNSTSISDLKTKNTYTKNFIKNNRISNWAFFDFIYFIILIIFYDIHKFTYRSHSSSRLKHWPSLSLAFLMQKITMILLIMWKKTVLTIILKCVWWPWGCGETRKPEKMKCAYAVLLFTVAEFLIKIQRTLEKLHASRTFFIVVSFNLMYFF